MSIFDRLKQSAVDAAATAATAIGNKRETFTFAALPESLAQLQALPEAALDTPFQTAALTCRNVRKYGNCGCAKWAVLILLSSWTSRKGLSFSIA